MNSKSGKLSRVISSSKAKLKWYVPPLVGTGELSLLVDHTGGQQQKKYPGGYFELIPTIWWAGRRYDDHGGSLIPFGHFERLVFAGGELLTPRRWEQEILPEEGRVRSRLEYRAGIVEQVTVLTPFGRRMIVVRSQIQAPQGSDLMSQFDYILSPPGAPDEFPKYMTINPSSDRNMHRIEYRVQGKQDYRGRITVGCDRPAELERDGNRFRLVVTEAGEELAATYYLIFADAEDEADLEIAIQENYTEILDRHRADWARFWERGWVEVPDKRLMEQWRISLYHLRSQVTRWSIPTGIFDTHWNGRYFYDEFYSFLALASSGHLELAGRVPRFRHATLDKARYRTWHTGARYAWESLEDGDDGAPHGASLDEIHHSALIALEAWLYWRYTDDDDFLEEIAYPVIREAAEFYRRWIIIELDEGAIIQNCIDMDEKVVPAQNPLYTACAVITNFRIAAEVAARLGRDRAERRRWSELADKLESKLPQDDEKFLQYEGAEHASMVVLGVLHPFEIYAPEHPKVKQTIYDFMDRTANPVSYAAGTDPWYMEHAWTWATGWIAVCLARMGDRRNTYATVKKAMASAGLFGAMNEHLVVESGEPTVPWFTTASGVFVHALNEMLVRSTPEKIHLLPAIPRRWSDLNFKLQVQGNATLNVRMADGSLQELILEDRTGTKEEKQRMLCVDPRFEDDRFRVIAGEAVKREKDEHEIAWTFRFIDRLHLRWTKE